MDLILFDQHFPMAYTVAAQGELARRFGGIEKIADAFDLQDTQQTMETMIFCAAVLIKGAADRKRVICRLMGEEVPEIMVPTETDLRCLMDASQLVDATNAVMETIKEGTGATVEVEPEKGKNAEATQSE